MKFSDLVDVDAVQRLCESFAAFTTTSTVVKDLDGNWVAVSAWQDICGKFHRVGAASEQACRGSDEALSRRLDAGERCCLHRCKNGLIDVVVPIEVGGEHVANLYVGQFLTAPPDQAEFVRRAEQHGFDKDAYLAALAKVPIIPAERIPAMTEFFSGLAGLIGELGLSRKRLEEANRALAAEKERYLLTVRSLPVVQFALDREGIFTLSDGKGLEGLGLSPGEVVGRSLLDVYADYPSVPAAFHRALAGEDLVSEHTFGAATFETHWSPVRDGAGAVVGVAGVALDVSGQRRLQEQVRQAQRLESIGRLAGGVAHDFNNLLTVILGGTEALRSDHQAGGPMNLEDLEQIQRAGERARDLTRQLLTFARKQVITPVSLDLDAAVARGEKLLRRVLGEDVELTVETGAAGVAVLCDPGQLEQVLVNLAVNARDAMPGGGRLTIATHLVPVLPRDLATGDEPEGDWVRLRVSDAGSGMTAEVKASLFEPFFTTKEQGKGTGLGLATVHGIVSQNGGRIRVESTTGRGTTFEIFLPRSARPADAPAPPPAPRQGSGHEAILVIEDDAQVRAVTARALRSAGYRVTEADSAAEALEVVRRGAALDLVVTDVVMPGLDGREVVDLLRREAPTLRALFVSGYSQDSIAQRGILEPGIEFLPKPFTAADLAARVRHVLDQR
jgi:PAS domain S-box-containing protein